MGRCFIQDSTLSAIAAAIRAKNGLSAQYAPGDMAAAIAALDTGGMSDCLNFIAADDFAVSILAKGISVSFQYSYDFEDWTDWPYTESGSDRAFTALSVEKGERLFVRGNNERLGSSSSIYTQFSFTGNPGSVYAFGSVMSLLSYAGDLVSLSGKSYCFYRLFYGCKCLAVAPRLPATIMAAYCYGSMFQGCTSLTTPPELPATTLANSCYQGMFIGCTGLTSAPALPATILTGNCYSSMFNGCINLITPPELPATVLATNCYQYMFYNCASLTTAPALPATTLADYCYRYMFYGCSSLTTPPELPATTLTQYCYYYMFYSCKALTTAPILPAKKLTQYCYQYMFRGCTNLTAGADMQAATTMASSCCQYMYQNCSRLSSVWTPNITSWTASYFTNWLSNVASSGTLYKPSGLTNITLNSSNGVPTGWSTAVPTKTVTFSAKGSGNLPFSFTPEGGPTVQIQTEQSATFTFTMPQSVTILKCRYEPMYDDS